MLFIIFFTPLAAQLLEFLFFKSRQFLVNEVAFFEFFELVEIKVPVKGFVFFHEEDVSIAHKRCFFVRLMNFFKFVWNKRNIKILAIAVEEFPVVVMAGEVSFDASVTNLGEAIG